LKPLGVSLGDDADCIVGIAYMRLDQSSRSSESGQRWSLQMCPPKLEKLPLLL
jgi:hypothetical protein